VPWFGVLSFDSSELPIITVYAMYVPMLSHLCSSKKISARSSAS
jgi:APA family basic amino acid/polyamine antiporter